MKTAQQLFTTVEKIVQSSTFKLIFIPIVTFGGVMFIGGAYLALHIAFPTITRVEVVTLCFLMGLVLIKEVEIGRIFGGSFTKQAIVILFMEATMLWGLWNEVYLVLPLAWAFFTTVFVVGTSVCLAGYALNLITRWVWELSPIVAARQIVRSKLNSKLEGFKQRIGYYDPPFNG